MRSSSFSEPANEEETVKKDCTIHAYSYSTTPRRVFYGSAQIPTPLILSAIHKKAFVLLLKIAKRQSCHFGDPVTN